MSHLSHVCGQQGLQFLHDKQTQGADWAGHLLQTGQADQQEQELKFHFHIHIRFLMLTWSPVAVPSSDVETSLLAESWGSFCSSSFLLEAQSPNSTHVSPGFCAHTYYLALDVEQKCSIQRRTDRGWTHQVTRALLQEFWQMHLHLWVAIWDALAFWEALAQSMQGFIDSLLQENGSEHVVDTCVENVFFYTNRHSATATLTFLRYYREDNICRVWRPAHVVSRRGSKSERRKYAGGVIQQHPHLRVPAGDHVGGQTDDLVALWTHVHSLMSRKHSEITSLKKWFQCVLEDVNETYRFSSGCILVQQVHVSVWCIDLPEICVWRLTEGLWWTWSHLKYPQTDREMRQRGDKQTNTHFKSCNNV